MFFLTENSFSLNNYVLQQKKTEVSLKHTDDSRAIDKLLWLHLISIRRKCSRTRWRRIFQRPQPTVVKLFKLHYVQYFATANKICKFERQLLKGWNLGGWKFELGFSCENFIGQGVAPWATRKALKYLQWIVKQLNLLNESYHCSLAFSRMKSKILFVISVDVFASGIGLSVICYFVIFFIIVIHISLNVIAL